MDRALRLAHRGQGRVEPNPMVGCVLVKAGRIVGEGYHRRYGGPHAEINALRQAGSAARGATLYVTLEPCSYHGQTPPCVDALITAGIKTVYAAVNDPNPRVNGAGLRRLRDAGINVHTGPAQVQARELIAPFTKRIQTGVPYVIAKWAQSIDGRIATSSGDSQWISGTASRRYAHRLRARVDAILVGSQTIIRDDPQLTARSVPLRRVAQRVIIDRRLRTPLRCQVIQSADRVPTVIYTSADMLDTRKAHLLHKKGARLETTRARKPIPCLRAVLRHLAGGGATNVLIEGGGTLLGSAFDGKFVDELYAFVAPIIIGGRAAPAAVVGTGVDKVRQAWRCRQCTVRRFEQDHLYHLRF